MKAKLRKSFYSCIDTFFEGTNAEQHNIINAMAKRENGKIIFYGAEDYFVADSQPFILPKLIRTKISVHFAREGITIKNLNDLKVKHLDLIGYYQAAFKKNITIK